MTPTPRLLFITNEPPHSCAAGSIYFHRLFRGYPSDRLLVITNSNLPELRHLLECRYASHSLWIDRLKRTRLWKWRTAARVLGGSDILSLSRLDRLVGDFRPDAVVTLMQDSWYYELAARYARVKNLPLILFVHDLPSVFEPVPPWLATLQFGRDRKIYEQAVLRVCVSSGMNAWFEREFGLPGAVVVPPSSPNPPTQALHLCRTLKHSGKLTLGYAGGLHYGYGEQIKNMIPAMRAANVQLEIFSPSPTGGLSDLPNLSDVLTFHGYAATPEDAWAKIIQRCDAVLLPYLDPPARHHLQYQTHFPSKLGDMLCLGLPTIITGPIDASGVMWCDEHGACAVSVADSSIGALIKVFEGLREDGDLRESLARRAQTAASFLSSSSLSSLLQGCIDQALTK